MRDKAGLLKAVVMVGNLIRARSICSVYGLKKTLACTRGRLNLHLYTRNSSLELQPCVIKHADAATKSTLFCRRHFHTYFLV